MLRFLVPPVAFNQSPREWLAALEGAGAASLAVTIAAALHDDSPKLLIPAGSSLEAELLLDDLTQMENKLVEVGLMPFGVNEPPPMSWGDAAENAVSLLAAVVRMRRLTGSSNSAQAEATLEPRTGQRDKPPVDSFQPVKVATKSADLALAVDPMVVESLTTVRALRNEHLRDSPFKSLTGSSMLERDAALPGELAHFLATYGQASSAYLVSNGMAIAELRGPGVPTALAGVRAHLLRRASMLVDEHFGAERAWSMRAEAERLALSMLTGSGSGDSPSVALEETMVKLLGGSRPHPSAEVDDEGGSISAGTLGTVSGPESQWSVRVAYPRWARGVAKAMGPILLARWGMDQSTSSSLRPSDLLGDEGDFGVAAAIHKVPHNLPVENFRSICRYLTSELARATNRHRREPGSPLPDIPAIVKTMSVDVFSKRMLDYKFALKVEEKNASLIDRLTQLEARMEHHRPRGEEGGSTSRHGGEKTSSQGNKRKNREGGAEGSTTAGRGKTQDAGEHGAGAHKGGAAGGEKAKSGTGDAARETSSRDRQAQQGTDEAIESMMGAVRALQTAVRARLALPSFKNNGDKEPCAWKALAGTCSKAGCTSCQSKVSMPEDLIAEVKARCKPSVFGQRAKPASGSA